MVRRRAYEDVIRGVVTSMYNAGEIDLTQFTSYLEGLQELFFQYDRQVEMSNGNDR